MATVPSSLRRRGAAEPCVKNSLHILPTVDHRSHRLIIANRGAAGSLPENSLPSYRLALELGADFIKTDIVSTSDKQLIAMFSVDLNVTTNVAEVFPDREPWFSPHAKRAGYWSFNFTYKEISTLKVKQRFPESRTTRYDNLFPVPSLLEVVQELNLWNENDLEQTVSYTAEAVNPLLQNTQDLLRKPSELELAKSGLYLELRDYAWQMKEADMDLVALMFQHFTQYSFEWAWTMPCFQELDYNTYKVPGLVIQSDDAESLKHFHDMWVKSQEAASVPEPPYVITAYADSCNQLTFWEDVAKLHYFITGVGPDKSCLFPENATSPTDSMTWTKASSMNLAVHPWTENPETESLASPKFASVSDETHFFLYSVGVEGIQTESVSVGVTNAKMGGPDGVWEFAQADIPPQCYNINREIGIYVGLSLFIMGILVGGLLCLMESRSRTAKEKEMEKDDPETEPMLMRAPPTDDHDGYIAPVMASVPVRSQDETPPRGYRRKKPLLDEENRPVPFGSSQMPVDEAQPRKRSYKKKPLPEEGKFAPALGSEMPVQSQGEALPRQLRKKKPGPAGEANVPDPESNVPHGSSEMPVEGALPRQLSKKKPVPIVGANVPSGSSEMPADEALPRELGTKKTVPDKANAPNVGANVPSGSSEIPADEALPRQLGTKNPVPGGANVPGLATNAPNTGANERNTSSGMPLSSQDKSLQLEKKKPAPSVDSHPF